MDFFLKQKYCLSDPDPLKTKLVEFAVYSMHEPKKSTRQMKSPLLNLTKVSASYLSTLHHAWAPPPPPPPFHSDSEYW